MRNIVPGVFVMLLTICSSTANAQATRTWVSGVGDDANPCSRTAPCKTFAGAISKTAAKGEINVLDPSGFGGVTITKSISIEAVGEMAGVLVSGTSGIIINAGAADVVTLRGLVIEGLGTGIDGIKVLAAGVVHVEDCTINDFADDGIHFTPSGNSKLFVKNVVSRNNAKAGILVAPTGGTSTAIVDHSNLENNNNGIRAIGSSAVTVSNSEASGNANAGFVAAPGGSLLVESSTAANNLIGISSTGGAVRVGHSTVTGNGTGMLATGGGSITSFGNNQNDGNGVDGGPTGTTGLD